MNDPQTIPPAHVLVLSRLLTGGASGAATAAELRDDLGPLLGQADGGGLRLEHTLVELLAAGFVVRTREGAADVVTLTPAGRSHTLEALGLTELPPGTGWAEAKANLLTARALGLTAPAGEAAERFATQGGFEGALLRARFGLPVAGVPTAGEAADALYWKLLGVDTSEPFELAAVKHWLLRRALGGSETHDDREALRALVAKSVGARPDDPAGLREAVLRHWLEGSILETVEDERPAPAAAPAAASNPAAVPAPVVPELAPLPAVLEFEPPADGGMNYAPLNLGDFARQVLEAADACPTGRFGASRVFISHVWQAFRGRPWFTRLELDVFKRFLVEAHQARLLDLGRADLVDAMNPDDVRASETQHLGQTFHFVRHGAPPA